MTDSMLSEVANKESALLAFLYENNSDSFAKAKMNITNLDANPNYLYMPYYTVIRQDELPVKIGARNLFNGDLINSTIRINQTRTLEYYPYSLIQEAYNDPEEAYRLLENYDNSIEESYRKYVYRNYLRIPDNIRETLNKICDEYISGDTTLEIAESIMRYFYQEFRYTQQPGITPYGQDFVEYFLTKQKHGFCAHFATAAAMLLRAEGIPARYVEGYYVQYDDAIEMTELENEDSSDWYEGRNIIGRDMNCNITVNDSTVSSTHAVILFRSGKYSISDQQSSHGTFVNGEDIELEPRYLKDGDVIRMGNTVFMIRFALFDAGTRSYNRSYDPRQTIIDD